MSKVAVIGAVVAVLDLVSPIFPDALMRLNGPFNNNPEICHHIHQKLKDLQRFTRKAAKTILSLSSYLTDQDVQNMLADISHPYWNNATISEALRRVLESQCDRYLQDTGDLYACVVDLVSVLGLNVRTVTDACPRPRNTVISPTSSATFLVFRKYKKVEKLIDAASHQTDCLRPTISRLATRPAANIHPAGHEKSSASAPQTSASDSRLTRQDGSSADAGIANAQAQTWPSGMNWEGIRNTIKACHDALLFVWKCKCPRDCHSVNVLLHHRFSSVPGDDDDCKVLQIAISSRQQWIRGELSFTSLSTAIMGDSHPCDACRDASDEDFLRLQVSLDKVGNPLRLYRQPSKQTTRPSLPYNGFRPDTITRRDRLSMKVIMASSVIQFGLTPWLGRFWTFEDMLFRRPKESDGPLLHEPFIGPPQQGDPGMTGFFEQSFRSRQNATMLSLAFFIAQLSYDGILPLEIETSQLKHTWKHSPDRLSTVLDDCVSQDEIKERLGKESYNAVMHCLMCFERGDLDLRDTAVVQGILTHVVWPLQREKASTF